MTRIILPNVFLVAAWALAGCGSSNTVQVSGTLLKSGAPYAAPQGQKLGVTLYAMDVKDATGGAVTANEPFPAEFNPSDSTFRVPGPEGLGIPPGKYRVAVIQQATREALERTQPKRGTAPDREADFLKGRYGPQTSPIVREIGASGNLSIDLDRPAQ